MLGRGVYRLPMLGPTGLPVLVAVTRAHRYLDFRPIRPEEDPDDAARSLWSELDQLDPPVLRLSS